LLAVFFRENTASKLAGYTKNACPDYLKRTF
jgi:hypothetical protein